MMAHDHTQEALDEYYTTGIDPTGGGIGPDFDPDSGEWPDDDLDEQEVAFYEEEKAHPWSGVPRPQKQRMTPEERVAEKRAGNQWTWILIVFMAVLALLAIIF